MKIYTKTGDTGTTSLIGGTRVPKHHIRIETYGTIDELNAYLGLIRDQDIDALSKTQLIAIQDRLFTMGSMLATDPNASHTSRLKIPTIEASDITSLEQQIDVMNEDLEPMTNFILPGGHQTVSFCHIARCVCRRAERLATHLNEVSEVKAEVIIFLNRLSDYLFVLARKLTKDQGAKEVKWIPKTGK